MYSGAAVAEAVAPGEGGVGPVDGEYHAIVARTNPVEYLVGGDGSVDGVYGLGLHGVGGGSADGMYLGSEDTAVHPVVAIGGINNVNAVEVGSHCHIAPFEDVAVGEDGGQAPRNRAVTVDGAQPVGHNRVVETVFAIVEHNVEQPAVGGGVGEARVGGLYVVHDSLYSGAAVAEAVAPSEGGVSPVDGEYHAIVAGANPVEDVGGGDGGVDRVLHRFGSNSGIGLADRCGGLGPGRLHAPATILKNTDARGSTLVAILEHVAVVKHLLISAIGRLTIDIGLPIVIGIILITTRQAQRVACGDNKEDVTLRIPRWTGHNLEAGIGGGDSIGHLLHSSSVIEEITPSKSSVRDAEVDDKNGAVTTRTHPILDVFKGDRSINRIVLCLQASHAKQADGDNK